VEAGEHAAGNVMHDPGEVARFHDRCSDLMRELLEGLAAAPDTPRPFPLIEEAIGWPRRRIASVLGGVSHLRHTEFAGRRPYHFHDERRSASGRWEMWMDAGQARAVRYNSPVDPPLCPTCGQPASQALAGAEHGWECRNEACSEFGQPVRDDEEPPRGEPVTR
jgi:hypothetical protein